jgi:hypothetical protein
MAKPAVPTISIPGIRGDAPRVVKNALEFGAHPLTSLIAEKRSRNSACELSRDIFLLGLSVTCYVTRVPDFRFMIDDGRGVRERNYTSFAILEPALRSFSLSVYMPDEAYSDPHHVINDDSDPLWKVIYHAGIVKNWALMDYIRAAYRQRLKGMG